jgi:hypothetical protein
MIVRSPAGNTSALCMGGTMAVKTHVTKIEAAPEGGVLVLVAIESDLGPVEFEVYADLKTDARSEIPLVNALDEVREKLLAFGRDLHDEMRNPEVLASMMHLSLPPEETEE